jgi:hypothetical protein
MMRRVVLLKLADAIGQDFAVVGLAELLVGVIPIFFAREIIVGRETSTPCFSLSKFRK